MEVGNDVPCGVVDVEDEVTEAAELAEVALAPIKASAGALFGSGQYGAAAEAYSSLLDDFLDFHPALASHEKYAAPPSP